MEPWRLIPNIGVRTYGLQRWWRWGGDGAGQQVVWSSTNMLKAGENIIQCGIAPLKLVRRFHDNTTEILWQNLGPTAV